MAKPNVQIGVRLDDEDRELLDALCEREKLKMSDVIRRALRAYATALGIQPRK